jgi:prepilin-type N-terminal cleavage/methylation domain-containing protein
MLRRVNNSASRRGMQTRLFARNRSNRARGFTLLELMIVISMIMILMSVAVPIYTPVRAPRGNQLSCKGWAAGSRHAHADEQSRPDVAERPQDLVVYGGTGRAARNWECYHAIVASLQSLDNDETLLVQSGKPVGIFPHPRIRAARAHLQLQPGGPLVELGEV